MKNKLLSCALSLCLIASFILPACQPTPDQPIVNSGDDSVLNDKIEATAIPTPEAEDENLASIYGFPEYYKDQFNCIDTDVKVNVDLNVSTPNVKNVPIYEIEPGIITAEQIKNFAESMHPGVTFYEEKNILTREEAEAAIREYQEYLNMPQEEFEEKFDYPESTRAQYEKYIEEYKALLPTLPETEEQPPADFEFHKFVGYYDFLTPELKDAIYSSGITEDYYNVGRDLMHLTAKLDDGSDVSIYAENRDDEEYRISKFEYSVGKLSEDSGFVVPEFRPHESTLTTQKMDSLAQNAIDYLGLGGVMVLHSIHKVDENDPASAWELKYRRGVAGWEVGAVTFDYDYNYFYGNETLTIKIQNDMIVSLVYENPYAEKRTENENVELLSFEDAYNAFKRQMTVEYTKGMLTFVTTNDENGNEVPVDEGIKGADVTVDKAELVMVRIPIKNGGYRYVPAWQFSGNRELDIESVAYMYYQHKFDRIVFLTINAVDGSRISGGQTFD